MEPDQEPITKTPRWVWVAGIVAVVFIAGLVLVAILGGGDGGHGPGRH